MVAAGGTAGTLVRYGLAQAAGEPLWATLAVNLTGAFLLGVILGWLQPQNRTARPGSAPAKASAGHVASVRGVLAPETRIRRRLRLAVGTGLLGGLTTYSTLMLETHRLLGGHVGLATAYSIGSLVAGLAAAFLGLRLVAAECDPAAHAGAPGGAAP